MVRAAIIALLALSAPAEAQDYATPPPSFATGNGALQLCKDRDGSPHAWYCLGFIEGVVSADALQRTLGSKQTYLCDMTHVTLEQEIDVVVKYLEDHPEIRHYDGTSLILRSLKLAFCDGSR